MEKYDQLAAEVMQLSETKLLSQLRFLSGAMTALTYEASEKGYRIASDGRRVYYNPRQILPAYQEEKESVAADLLHILLHCLMGHPFCPQEKEARIWNLACDLAAEGARMEMAAHFAAVKGDPVRKDHIARICDYAKGTAAEAIYNYLLEDEMPEEELAYLEQLFARDDHCMWSVSGKQREGGRTAGKAGKRQDPASGAAAEEEEAAEAQEADPVRAPDSGRDAGNRKRWKKIARQTQTELTFFNKRQGNRAGRLIRGMKPFLFEEVDYSEFLRIFGTENEVMKVSDEEFDVIYYTYGLKKYGNIPLVEPLEYSNLNRIREFVIAIDTSGSVQGELVEEFLRRTCHVLKQTNSFASQVNIYLIQCDAQIQSCTRITSLEELDHYIADMKLSGFGGTDFRPVFSYIDQLIEEQKIRKLNGLLYFTDGIGSYPERSPSYKTAFIFKRDDYISPEVPGWAIKAVLTSDNIKMMKDKL